MRSFSSVSSISAAFTVLATALLTAPVASAQTINSFDRGNYQSNGLSLNTNINYFVGDSGNTSGILARNFFVFNIPTLVSGQQYISATFRFNTFNILTGDPSETLSLRDYTGSIAALTAGSIDGASGIAIYNDLGSGSDYGSITLTPAQNNQFVTVTLSAAALANINVAAGNQLAFGGFISTLDATINNEYIAANSLGTAANDGNTQLILTTGAVTPSAAPEPGSIVLALIAGLPALGMLHRRSKRS